MQLKLKNLNAALTIKISLMVKNLFSKRKKFLKPFQFPTKLFIFNLYIMKQYTVNQLYE